MIFGNYMNLLWLLIQQFTFFISIFVCVFNLPNFISGVFFSRICISLQYSSLKNISTNVIKYQIHIWNNWGTTYIFTIHSSTPANDLIPQDCLVICFSIYFFVSLTDSLHQVRRSENIYPNYIATKRILSKHK